MIPTFCYAFLGTTLLDKRRMRNYLKDSWKVVTAVVFLPVGVRLAAPPECDNITSYLFREIP